MRKSDIEDDQAPVIPALFFMFGKDKHKVAEVMIKPGPKVSAEDRR